VSTANFHSLQCHPASTAPALLRVAVRLSRVDNGDLRLDYRLQGVRALRLPPPATPGPADGLWQHTCCEAFMATVDGSAYREFNFSPAGQWAIYDFTTYRQRKLDAPPNSALLDGLNGPPGITCQHDGDTLQLAATIPAALLPSGGARIGLTVVAETPSNDKSYWALAHAAVQPDFHLAASFTLPLP